MNKTLFPGIIYLLLAACSGIQTGKEEHLKADAGNRPVPKPDTATLAGGCFWATEAAFEQIKGVQETVSGYAGGKAADAAYEKVGTGNTGHAESVQIYYDPQQIPYSTLLDIFFTAHDPTQLNRQGPDVGTQYRSVIFYRTEEEKKIAKEKIQKLTASGTFKQTIVTKIAPYSGFYPAEAYHQNYVKQHPQERYIVNVSMPKINKVRNHFKDLLKE